MAKKCPGGCGRDLDANEGVGTLPGTKIMVCRQCYKDATSQS